MNDHYKTLGVQENATTADIKTAFRDLVKKYHPDQNSGNETYVELYKNVNEAYKVLSDDAKRFEYDAHRVKVSRFRTQSFVNDIFGMHDISNPQTRQNSSPNPWTHPSPAPNPQSEAPGVDPGEDIEMNVEITFNEALEGCKKLLHLKGFKGSIPCEPCGGMGSVPGSRRSVCSMCLGNGRSVSSRGNLRKCSVCKGHGTVPLQMCSHCKGTGQGIYKKDILITIPSGVDTGQRIRVAGQGCPGTPPGDLFVIIRVFEDPRFRRDGLNLHMTIGIPFKTAILGGVVKFEGYNRNMLEMEVMPGTQQGDVATIRGAGVVSTLGKNRGDVVTHIVVQIPKNLSARAKALLCELSDEIEGIHDS